MVKKVAAFAAEYQMLEKGDKVIAGISGGADSVCLLLMLLELQKQIPFEVIVVHINHGLRGETARRDEEFVENLCRQYHLPIEICREDVELFAQKGKQSLEEAGRNVRRAAFQRISKKYGGTKIALAHHKNDNAETLLMNLARGSGLSGLVGIHPVSGRIIRPLLCLTRAEIEQFLLEKNMTYCVDETNASNNYTRNRIRNRILPLLETEVNEKAVIHMADTASQLLKVYEYMEEQEKICYQNSVRRVEYGLLFEKAPYEEMPDVFQGMIWKHMMREVSGKEQDIHRSHIESLSELMKKQVGRQVNLPYGMRAERCYEGVCISMEKQRQKEGETECVDIDFQQDGKIRIGNRILSYRTVNQMEESDVLQEEKVYTKYFDYDIIKRTVTVRTRRPGDYITIDGEGRTQKLKSYFINEKIPRQERERLLLLAEGSHVLWIIGYRRGYAYHVKPHAEKIIEISINKGEENHVRKD